MKAFTGSLLSLTAKKADGKKLSARLIQQQISSSFSKTFRSLRYEKVFNENFAEICSAGFRNAEFIALFLTLVRSNLFLWISQRADF